ncbi:hypothetical protein Bequi_10665 [Brachybacterium sp. JHP9]|uniref:Uncharacterized protein n=1 Tax=Brachybacterium equifaecis TaxID=2910770 RepID=A0ABT0R1N1_9MICO|nr:hypothetical protein [Brachybacterium equifaecis]MCL6423839.1 hypothetical protein [Brachybacterium equifaecis]
MSEIELSWDYCMILEWRDSSGHWCEGPAFEGVFPPTLMQRISAWTSTMDEAYGPMGNDEEANLPEGRAEQIYQALLGIRAEIEALGFAVVPLDEWWVRAAAQPAVLLRRGFLERWRHRAGRREATR